MTDEGIFHHRSFTGTHTSRVMQVQVAAFLVFTCYRAALYSFLGAYIAVIFG